MESYLSGNLEDIYFLCQENVYKLSLIYSTYKSIEKSAEYCTEHYYVGLTIS